jgi:hypothetical protein
MIIAHDTAQAHGHGQAPRVQPAGADELPVIPSITSHRT